MNQNKAAPPNCWCMVWITVALVAGLACCGIGASLAARLVEHWTS